MNMNKISFISALGLFGAAALTGCYDLATEPLNQYVTESQKQEWVAINPSNASAAITGITGLFSTYMQVYDEHNDFGYPSVMLFTDLRGEDMVAENIDYNWFAASTTMNDCNTTSYLSNMAWRHLYRQAFACNNALRSFDPESEDPELQFYMAQALAIRAFDYFQLAQIFQATYAGNEDKPCVMLITEKNSEQAAKEGIRRATVQATYEQITADIDSAIVLLDKCGIKPKQMISSKPKRLVSLATAYGLRARINLVLNRWEEAAADAQAAIDNFEGAPMSAATASKPGLVSLDESNWMWGIAIAETDRVVTSAIVNWPSHMGSLNYGYASVGAWRMVSKKLYDQIPATDVRRNWWLDKDGISAGLTEEQQEYCADYEMPAYTQVKFAPYNDVLEQDVNANDIILMRVEEMYYIKAEALAMAGQDGASVLTAFVQQYRDPAFTGTGNVQEDVWNQRRIEFWGEGINYYTDRRLKKGMDRNGCGFDPKYSYTFSGTDQIWVMPIPESEINGNKLFSNTDNNPSVSAPTL